MSLEISGRVLTSEDETPIYGATVEIFDDNRNSSFLERRVITNRGGEFTFYFKDSEVDTLAEEQVEFSLQVSDSDGMVLARDERHPIVSAGDREYDTVVDDDILHNAHLPRQPGGESLISTEIFQTIDLAIEKAAAPEELPAYREAVDGYFCSLPPAHSSPDLLDTAEGVLQGRPEDIRQFRATLDQFEAWNHRAYPFERKELPNQEAQALLEEDVLEQLAGQRDAGPSGSRESIMAQRPVLVLVAAAMRVAGDDPARIHRNLGILFEQYCGLEEVGSIHRAARDAISGHAADQRFFLNTVEVHTGMCEPDGVPEPPDVGVPPPRPCPGGPPWPPDPDDPAGDYPPEGYPGFTGECTAAEIIPAVKEYLERRTTYSIDDISPPRACPGETITITGSDFVFEGHSGVVLFPGLTRGTKVPATPESWTDTEIEVVVPEGAVCGDLELDIRAGATILACDREFDLFNAPDTPVEFHGGDTLITYFDFADTVPEGCLDPGGELAFRWDTCNADGVRLTITDSGGNVELDETFDDDTYEYTYTIPTFDSNRSLTATLEVSGPCGEDSSSLEFGVRKGTFEPVSLVDDFEPEDFENWHGNVSREAVGTYAPENLEDLVRAVRTAEEVGERLGVMGSRFSFTDCIVPHSTTDLLIDSSDMKQLLDLEPDILSDEEEEAYDSDEDSYFVDEPVAVTSDGLRSEIDSVLDPAIEDEYDAVVGDLSPIEERLVHVEAGIKLHDLNCLLDSAGLALPTMGGGQKQSVAGAFSTGTHGSTVKLPPPSDFVRAIHLVGPGGHQWWLEPDSDPITNPDRMEELKNRDDSGLDPCLKVVYDDDLFEAALVSFGSAGIIYSVVIETVDAHRIEVETSGENWTDVKRVLQESVIEPDTPDHLYVDVTLNPTRHCRVTTMDLTTEPLSEPEPDLTLEAALLSFLFGPGVLGAGTGGIVGVGTGAIASLLGIIPDYIARRTAEIASIPFTPWRWEEIREIRHEIEVVRDLAQAIQDVSRIIASGADDEAIAESLPNLLNLIWDIGVYVVEGREVLDGVQNIYTNYGERPAQAGVGKSFRALTMAWGSDCPREGLLESESEDDFTEPNAYRRLIQSWEYALPAGLCIEFVDAILERADEIRSGDDALILILNLRFTQPTRALIGMQQFERTCHVEVWTPRGLDGNAELHEHVADLVESFDAVPHWGQLHSTTRDFSHLYGWKLDRWQRAMDRIATESADNPNTFRHDFALERGLLSEL